ncbi:MAG: TonB-dependent receptor family protein, partial [Bacteroidales bacterium]|nr:TonB-dependent receptor family protein [Bacteroidales bacterium]
STTVSSQTNSDNRLLAEKLVITAPVPQGELTFGEEASSVHRTHDFIQSGFSADSHVKQETSIWSLFANYSLQLGKFSMNTGLRWQNEHNIYDIDGQRNDEMSPDYSVLIPRVSLDYNSGNWQHRLSYNCSRYNPQYSLLSSSVNYRSKYEYDTGNPLLKPQTHHNFSWTSSWKWINAEAYYQYHKNTIRSFQTAYDDVNHPGVVIMDYRNTPKQEYYGITLNFTPKVGIWQMNYSADLYFCNDDVYPLGITHKWNGLIAVITLDNIFSLPHSWLLNIKGGFTPYNESGPCQTEANGYLNLRLGKQFLKDKSLSVAILANDIFKTNYMERVAYGGINIRTQYHEYQDKRRFGIDISWKFNATRSRYKGSHAGQDERNRL